MKFYELQKTFNMLIGAYLGLCSPELEVLSRLIMLLGFQHKTVHFGRSRSACYPIDILSVLRRTGLIMVLTMLFETDGLAQAVIVLLMRRPAWGNQECH